MNNPESVDTPVTIAARSLGRMARGKSKRYSPEERQRRAARMREMNLARRAKAIEDAKAIERVVESIEVAKVLSGEVMGQASLPAVPVPIVLTMESETETRSAMDQAFIDSGWAVRSNGDYGKMHGQNIRWIVSVSDHAGRLMAEFSGERLVSDGRQARHWADFAIPGSIFRRPDWTEAQFVADIEDYLSEQVAS